MKQIEDILDDINEYEDRPGDLIADLKSVGIRSYDDFVEAAERNGTPVKRNIREIVKSKLDNFDEEAWATATSLNTEASYQEYLDSSPDGNYRSEARMKIAELQLQSKSEQGETIWENVDKESIQSLKDFIAAHSDSPYVREAKKLMNELRHEELLGMDINALIQQIKAIKTQNDIIDKEEATYTAIVNCINKKRITVDDFLEALKEDNNLINGAVANKLWEEGYISDYSFAGIEDDFIQHMMYKQEYQGFPAPPRLERITKVPCTEVYFWGIPSSGKSCALGAILSVANSGKVARSMSKDPECQGYGYMTRLARLFSNPGSVGNLPEGTAISSTYEMGMILEDEKGREHPITCIDLAGELIECMYRHDASEPLTDEQSEVLQTLTDVLVDNRTQNRKIHYFVIEYGAEDRLYKGLPQRDYLDAAVAYINRTGIFKRDTDALFLLITKIDKSHKSGDELKRHMVEYLSSNYEGFINGLKKICKDNEINGGTVSAQPFTLGKVCFQSYCKFDPESASLVVDTLIKNSYGYKPGKLSRIREKLTR